jgi:hypothetical protein
MKALAGAAVSGKKFSAVLAAGVKRVEITWQMAGR